jgi:hypothetical protein
MISERQFLRGYNSFWREYFPNLEPFTHSLHARDANHPAITRWVKPLSGSVSPQWNDIIAEIAFNTFARAIHEGGVRTRVTEVDIESAIVKMGKIRGEPLQHSQITAAIVSDADCIASRLARFFDSECNAHIHPFLPGFGILNSLHPDVIAGETLFEIKSSRSALKHEDIKQVLTYFLLGLLNGWSINTLCLVNPRRGTCFTLETRKLSSWLGAPPQPILKSVFRKILTH